jgi:hypothetical protein
MDKLGSGNRAAAFFLALLVMAGMSVLSALGQGSLGFYLIPSLMAQGFLGLALLLSLTFAGRFCRKAYTPARFSGFLVPGVLLAVVIMTAPLALFALLAWVVSMGDSAGFILGLLVFVVVVAAVLLAMLLPFLWLAFGNSLYRARFHGVFRLKGMTVPKSEPSGVNS